MVLSTRNILFHPLPQLYQLFFFSFKFWLCWVFVVVGGSLWGDLSVLGVGS